MVEARVADVSSPSSGQVMLPPSWASFLVVVSGSSSLPPQPGSRLSASTMASASARKRFLRFIVFLRKAVGFDKPARRVTIRSAECPPPQKRGEGWILFYYNPKTAVLQGQPPRKEFL